MAKPEPYRWNEHPWDTGHRFYQRKKFLQRFKKIKKQEEKDDLET